MLKFLKRVFPGRLPSVEPQLKLADCGYVCAAALMALHGHRTTVASIKNRAGLSSRGLTLRRLRDLLGACGYDARAVKYDVEQPSSYPCPGILHLKAGHYIVVARRLNGGFRAYFPEKGWVNVKVMQLKRQLSGFGVEANPGADLALAPERVQLASTLARFALGAFPWRKTMLVIALGCVVQLCTVAIPLISMTSVDHYRLSSGGGGLGQIGLAFLCVSIISSLSAMLSSVLQRRLEERASSWSAQHIYTKLSRRSSQWFEDMPPTGVANIADSVERLIQFSAATLSNLGGVATMLVAGLVALWFSSPWLVVPGLALVVFDLVVEFALRDRQANAIANAVERARKRDLFIFDVLARFPLLKRQGDTRRAKRRYVHLAKSASQADNRLATINDVKAAISTLARALSNIVFLAIAAIFLGRGEYTFGGFVAVAAYKDLLAQSLAQLGRNYSHYRSLEIHLLQASELLDDEAHSDAPVVTFPVSAGAIEVRRLAFRYDRTADPVVERVDLTIRPGELITLAGESGAGKSTFAKLLSGTFSPTEGDILIDGASPPNCSGIGAVMQNDGFFAGTIRDNILLFRSGYTDQDVFSALDIAELRAFVLTLPMKLDTPISDGGGGLSGGQRQRILIARAVLPRPKLLILDEATSALDVGTEKKVIENIKSLGVTTILVAHRPEAQKMGDRVFLFSSGMLEEVKSSSGEAEHEERARCIETRFR